jgi:hypothetical protein
MGYELHIVRTKHSGERDPITFGEWKSYVVADPEMELSGRATVTVENGALLFYANPGLAVWTKYSGHGRKNHMACFNHVEGRISVKNPDREIALKMLEVAKKLSARLVGDNGEDYGDPVLFDRSFPR